MASWIVNRAYILEQNAQKMREWKAEQDAKRIAQSLRDETYKQYNPYACTNCEKDHWVDDVCANCGELRD